jgi:DNA-binding response OmpR family regulator
MVVSAEACDDVETCLVSSGWEAVKASDGVAAVVRAHREHFDLAVLISTGEDMDIMETLLNLRDTQKSLPLLVVTSPCGFTDGETANETYERAVPNTKVLSMEELGGFIKSLKDSRRQES